MEQFQQIMNLIIGRALEVNNEKLSQDISCLVNEKMGKELEFLFQASDQKEEERFRQLDETLRSYQKGGQAEAAAAKVPFLSGADLGEAEKAQGRKVITDTAGDGACTSGLTPWCRCLFL